MTGTISDIHAVILPFLDPGTQGAYSSYTPSSIKQPPLERASTMKMLRCVIIRGGTSKGIFFHENALPPDPQLRDKVILDVFGSPDVREIDGLGGADVLTSKVAIISPSNRDDADIDYTFGQVMFDRAMVNYGINCGNISAGVGPFAIDEGLVKAIEPVTTVRIFNTNTKKVLIAHVPVKDGKAVVDGDYHIDGVPATAAKIGLDFAATAGTIRGTLLPTGNVKDRVNIDGIGEIEISIVDAANPTVFAFAKDVGITGKEKIGEAIANKEIWKKAEAIRDHAAQMIGVVNDWQYADVESPVRPFCALVMEPTDYVTYEGENIKAADIDLRAMVWAAHAVHKAYPGTGTVCTGTAAMIEGTLVNKIVSARAKTAGTIIIGHPSGRIDVEVDVQKEGHEFILKKAILGRTARRILEGYVYLKPWTLPGSVQ